MFGKRGEIIDSSENNDVLVRNHGLRRIALGALATIGIGFVGGFFAAAHNANSERDAAVVGRLQAFAAQDGFDTTEFRSGNTDGSSMMLTVRLGECPLSATISVDRDPNGNIIDITTYQMNVSSNTDTVPNRFGAEVFEPETKEVQNLDGLIAQYGPNPCETVHSN